MIVRARGTAEWDHKDIEWAQLDKTKMLGSQTAMAVGLRGMLYPNSVIKTHVQTNVLTGTTKEVARTIIERNGLRGLWRGFFTCQVGIIPAHSVYVTALECSKQYIKQHLAIQKGFGSRRATQLSSFMGGAAASLCAAVVRTPTDIIAQRLMIQGTKGASTAYSNGFHAFRTILKTEGIRGLYAGLGAAVLVSVPFSATFWGSYSSLKFYIGHSMSGLASTVEERRRRKQNNLSNLSNSRSSNSSRNMMPAAAQAEAAENQLAAAINASTASSENDEISKGILSKAPFGMWEALVFSSAAFLSASLAVAVTNPIDLVKTRIQTKAKTGRTAEGGRLAQSGAGIRQHLWSIVRYEGWWSLTKGFSSRVLTTGPFSILGILVYEGTKHMSRKSL
mmetsp:Transcript_28196/g.45889  ORF Transcript_28196/g.45889 Transcript_28196/m.45889 type:complete len:392 (-) Transcript_28196:170-1345(-)